MLAHLSYPPDDAEGAAWLAGILGVSVRAEESCVSGLASAKVWDVVFETTPPVRLRSGWNGTVELEGKAYKAWQWGEGSIDLSLYAPTVGT